MSNYPESMLLRNHYLEKENLSLREIIHTMLDERIDLKIDIKKAHEWMQKDTDEGRVWFWQGDGYDLTRSMVNDLPVLIRADQLRKLLKDGEIIADELKEEGTND